MSEPDTTATTPKATATEPPSSEQTLTEEPIPVGEGDGDDEQTLWDRHVYAARAAAEDGRAWGDARTRRRRVRFPLPDEDGRAQPDEDGRGLPDEDDPRFSRESRALIRGLTRLGQLRDMTIDVQADPGEDGEYRMVLLAAEWMSVIGDVFTGVLGRVGAPYCSWCDHDVLAGNPHSHVVGHRLGHDDEEVPF
jgi:hypothetical protein